MQWLKPGMTETCPHCKGDSYHLPAFMASAGPSWPNKRIQLHYDFKVPQRGVEVLGNRLPSHIARLLCRSVVSGPCRAIELAVNSTLACHIKSPDNVN